MGIGPSLAVPKVLEMTGIDKSEVDLFEVSNVNSYQCSIYKIAHSVDQRSFRFHVCVLCP